MPLNQSVKHRLSAVHVLICCLLIVYSGGCGNGFKRDYGGSNGYTARRSINGFSAFRDGFESAGFEQRDLLRLTDRARRMQAVVWTPRHPGGIARETADWLDSWLRLGHRTLIYVVPDSGSESDYFKRARSMAPPSQRLEYRRKYAEQLITEHRWQLNRTPFPANRWFTAIPEVQRSALQPADTAPKQWSNSANNQPTDPRRFEWVLEAYDPKNPASQPAFNRAPVGPGSKSMTIGVPATNTTPGNQTNVGFEPLLQTDEGDTIVARISSENWNDSQVIVVAGGSMLTNFGLVQERNQQLANQLIASTTESLIASGAIDGELRLTPAGKPPEVGFTDAILGLPISEQLSDIPRATGAELLTVFPISLVTIHLAILGIVICLILFPVFGRPRHVQRRVLTHFGDHLDAVAHLMRRRGGEAFARHRISEYMKRIHGETSGKWVIGDSPPHRQTKTTPSARQIPHPNADQTNADQSFSGQANHGGLATEDSPETNATKSSPS
jgi:hypothetical protein